MPFVFFTFENRSQRNAQNFFQPVNCRFSTKRTFEKNRQETGQWVQGQVLGPYEDSLMEDRGHFPGMRIMLFWAQARTSDKIMFEALLALQAPERKILIFFLEMGANWELWGDLGTFERDFVKTQYLI